MEVVSLKGHLTILHLSDPHFSAATARDGFVESIALAKERQSEPKGGAVPRFDDVDLIAVTGDITVGSDDSGFRVCEEVLSQLADVFTLERDRVLIIPGNHDVERRVTDGRISGVTWKTYGRFAERWYKDQPRARPVSFYPEACKAPEEREELPPSAYVVDHRSSLGIVCYLFNAYGGIAQGEDLAELMATELGARADVDTSSRDPLANVGIIGQRQLQAFDGVVAKLDPQQILDEGDGRIKGPAAFPGLALVHHHLFAIRSSPGERTDSERLNILLDFPDATDWLSDHQCRVVLHGHRHVPYFASFRSERLPRSLAARARLAEPTDKVVGLEAFCGDPVDIVVTGIGRCTQSTDGEDLPPLLQLLRLVRHPLPRYDVAVATAPWVQEGQTWYDRGLRDELPAVLVSNETISELERQRYLAECFLADEISTRTWHPTARVREDVATQAGAEAFADDWFWTYYDSVLEKFDLEAWYRNEPGLFDVGGEAPRPRTPREAFVASLITRLNEHNRALAVFGLLPSQLNGLYTLGALLFSKKDVQEKAAEEFQRPEWEALLQSPLVRSKPEFARFRNHLEDANVKIAQEVSRRWASRRVNKTRRVRPIRIIEVGFGGLRTIQWVVAALREVTDLPFEYLGIDVSPTIVAEARHVLAEGAPFLDQLVPLPGMQLVERAEVSEWLHEPSIDRLADSVDIVLASYSIHHSVNNALVERSLLDGSFGRVFQMLPDHGGSKVATRRFRDAVRRGDVFADIEVARRQEADIALAELVSYYSLVPARDLDEAGRAVGAGHEAKRYRRNVTSVLQFFPDYQQDNLHKISRLLTARGIFAMADPNGYSRTFNRHQLVYDWPILMSHFAEWHETVRRLHIAGLGDGSVWRQVRRLDMSVISEPVAPQYVALSAKGQLNEEGRRNIFTAWTRPGVGQSIVGDGMGEAGGQSLSSLLPQEIEDQHLGYVIVAEKAGARAGRRVP